MQSMGVYLHIPFCVKKCDYCDFLSGPASKQQQKEYVEALKREILYEAPAYQSYQIKTIFIGGGTPSILDAESICEILQSMREQYVIDSDAEITIELNPGTAARQKLIQLNAAGINRLSIGLQSADNKELQMLGRIHTYEEFLQTYEWAREAGFRNINVDLMSALPGQCLESWLGTLKSILALEPEHLSAYSLIVEEGTPLCENLDKYAPVPDEEEDRRMYQQTKQILESHGYQRYEISNYAKTGYECKHNKIYWQRGIEHLTNYLGLGLGAASTISRRRWKNTSNMDQYLQAFLILDNQNKQEQFIPERDIKEEMQMLSENDCMEEFMFLGLRMMCGISITEFQNSFGKSIDAVYGKVLQKWTAQGMLARENDIVKLTDAGIDISNIILADFLL